ncbi:MAG: tetratricopeptide repeat protein [Deltaproteobacteria bacterium]|nr:tetratricopeptide repeat protein [Deltaproteobacteria bacterium]
MHGLKYISLAGLLCCALLSPLFSGAAPASAQDRAVAERLVEFGRMPNRDARQLVRTISRALRDNARAGGDGYDRTRTAIGRAILDGPGADHEEYEQRLRQVLARMGRGLDEELLEALFRPRPNASVLCATDLEVSITECDALIGAASRNRSALPYSAPDDGRAFETALRDASVSRRHAREVATKLGAVMLGVPRILTRDRRGRGLLRLLESCPGALNAREAQVRAWHVGPTEGMARCIAGVLVRGSAPAAAAQRTALFFEMSPAAAEAFLTWGAPEQMAREATARPAPAPPPPRRAAPTASELLDQGRVHFRAGRFREAASAYGRVTTMDPTNTGALSGLGSSLFRMRNPRGAVTAYRQAVQLEPGNPNYRAFLGEALAASGDAEGAAAEYQAALAIQPNNFIASQGLSRIGARANRQQTQQNRSVSPAQQASLSRSQGREHFRGGRFPQAAAAYEQATRAEPNHPGAFSGLGAARLQMGDTAGAVSAYQNAVRISPNSSGFWSALARAQARSDDHQAAIASLRRAVQLDPDNRSAQQGLAALGAAPLAASAQPAAAPPAQVGDPTHAPEALPETPSREQIIAVMRPLSRGIGQCVPGFSGRLTFSLSVAGDGGTVSGATVAEEDQLSIDELECVTAVIEGASFGSFTRESLEISYPYMI